MRSDVHSFEFLVVGEGLGGNFGDLILLQSSAIENILHN